MEDIAADTCSSSVPGVLRYKFGDHSQDERKEIIAEAMYELRDQLAFRIRALRDASCPRRRLNLKRSEIPDKVELLFEGGCTRYEDLKVFVLSEPNPDPKSAKQKPCIVRADIQKHALPVWMQPWDLAVGQ